MVTLHHATKISASRHDVYTSLTDLTRMAAWHGGKLEGQIEAGEVLTLQARPETHFDY